jgi:uncharacterized protein (DUF3084 family)
MTITEKIILTENQLKQIIEEHNQLVTQKQELVNQATQLQGALKVLKELDVDQPTNTEAT